MKQFLLILITLFISHHGLCQKLFFSDTSNQWIVDYHEYDPGIDKKYDVFYRLMDAVEIGGKQYLTLKSYTTFSLLTVAFIREDTAEEKVYARNISTNDTSEHLLYDYTLVPGDTFLMHRTSDTIRHYVMAMDTLVINGIAHRRWQFNHITPNTIDYQVVEGVGSMRDPLTPHAPIQPFGIGWYLKCFRNTHTGTSANNPVWYTANCILGVDDPELFSDEIRVFPNPARGEINLTWPAASKAKIITIYDLAGRLIVRLFPRTGQQELMVNTASWTKGIYLVKTFLEDGSFRSQRLVVEN